MRLSHSTAWVLSILGICCCSAIAVGQGAVKDQGNSRLHDLRWRIAKLEVGTSAKDVLKLLGKPDEVRLPDETTGRFDGGNYEGEVERWAYAVMGKGMFAKGGIVSMDKNGKVVHAAAPPTDSSFETVPSDKLPKNDQLIETPSKLSCHLSDVAANVKDGFKAKVTLKNAGKIGFELKGNAGLSMISVVWFEMYDSDGTILIGDSYQRLLAPFATEKVIVSVPAGKELSAELSGPSFDTIWTFGRLPAGKYSLRVSFPFDKEGYYPSNLVRFELTNDESGKKQPKK